MQREIRITLIIFVLLLLGTTLAILYARGYRLGVDEGKPQLSKTGILNASSIPNGANIWIDDHLTSATDNAINLTPGQYKVTIGKDGYHSWQKDVQILKEEVTNTDAILWPQAPTLQSLSTFGISDPVIDPLGAKVAFKITNQQARKNGIYVLDMTRRSLPVLVGQSASTQIATDVTDAFSRAQLMWSPDGEELIASVSSQLTSETTYYLLDANTLNETPQDVTATYDTVRDTWRLQRVTKEQSRLVALKPPVKKLVQDNFQVIAWSPDDKKVLYQAKQTGELPLVIRPRRIGNNLLYERRDLEKGGIYVYNVAEDVNTRIIESKDVFCDLLDPLCKNHTLTWFPTSNHLIYVHDRKIEIVEDDGANTTTIYAGPFAENYVFPWPDGSRLVILTNLGNTNIPPTFYTISLR